MVHQTAAAIDQAITAQSISVVMAPSAGIAGAGSLPLVHSCASVDGADVMP
jgi:hypothetical protein